MAIEAMIQEGQYMDMGARAFNLSASREQDSFIEAVFNTLSQGIVIFNSDGSVRTMNRAAVKIHGFDTIPELHRRFDHYAGLCEWFYPDGRPMLRGEWPPTRALKGEIVKRSLLYGRNRRSGHSWHGIYTATPVFDENGEVQAAVVVIQDITDPNRAEALMARLASMVESSAVPMIGLTRDGIIVSWNAAAESLFGYSASEIVGQPVALLGSCEDRHDKVDTIRCVREGGVVRNLETVRKAKDGRKIPVLLTVAPIRDEVGAVVGMSASVIDNTQSKRAEFELKEAHHRKDEILAMLAHELRDPLAPMRNAVHVLRMCKQEPARAEQAVSILERQLQHMARLIDDLSDVAPISRRTIQPRCEPMDPRTALEAAS
jgi:PAS domain S-box-containing protein